MTQDVDLLSVRAEMLAEELRQVLATKFHMAVRVREVGAGGYRLYQLRQPQNRHLADIRQVDVLPPTRIFAGVLVLDPADLVAEKVIAYQARRGRPKAGTDWRDIASLLLAFPALKTEHGPVAAALTARGVDSDVMRTWAELAAQELASDEDE